MCSAPPGESDERYVQGMTCCDRNNQIRCDEVQWLMSAPRKAVTVPLVGSVAIACRERG